MAKITLTLPIISGGGGGGSDTNLSYIPNPIQGTVTSDTGTDATIPLADNTNAGLLSSAEKTKIENSIPLSGTTVGNPVTGTIETNAEVFIQTPTTQFTDDYGGLRIISEHGITYENPTNTGKTASTGDDIIMFKVHSNNPLARGISGAQDFSPNITDLDYAQKIYVDTKEPLKGIDDNYVTDAEKIVLSNTSGTNTGDQDLSGKQDTLVSGTNIKTKGGISLLGSGDIPNSAKITTTVSITNATLTVAGDVQEGKIVKIDNGVNVINYTVNGTINASFIKMGTGAITFVQGSGRTLTGANGTLILNGAVNSTASIVSDGTVDTLYINNL